GSTRATASRPVRTTAPTYHLSLAGIPVPSSRGGAPTASTSVPRAGPLGVRIHGSFELAPTDVPGGRHRIHSFRWSWFVVVRGNPGVAHPPAPPLPARGP